MLITPITLAALYSYSTRVGKMYKVTVDQGYIPVLSISLWCSEQLCMFRIRAETRKLKHSVRVYIRLLVFIVILFGLLFF